MTITLRTQGMEVGGRRVTLSEYEPLQIEVMTPRLAATRPDVTMDGASIGSPEVSLAAEGMQWTWLFRGESWCGRSVLTVLTDAAPVRLQVNVRPSGCKYSENDYERMIDHIGARGAGLPWGLAPGLSKVEQSEGVRLSVIHPALIDHYCDLLSKQLERLLADPVRGAELTSHRHLSF